MVILKTVNAVLKAWTFETKAKAIKLGLEDDITD